jgi:hypothetical protein
VSFAGGSDSLLADPAADIIKCHHGVGALMRIRADHDHAELPLPREQKFCTKQRGHASIEQKQAPMKPHRCSEQTWRSRKSPEKPPTKAGAAKKRANPARPNQDDIDAKKAEAALSISFVRHSSAFSRRSRLSSADSSLVMPGRCPESTSARRTQVRTVSAATPNLAATDPIAAHSDG